MGPNSLSTWILVGQVVLGQRPDLQHLTGVVPFVQGLVGVDALVALEPDQSTIEHGRQDLGQLGLAHPDFAFEKQGTTQCHRHVDRGGESPVGQVAALAQPVGELGNTG